MNLERPVQRVALSEAAVERQLIDAVDRSELRHQPFDHIYMEQVLDPGTYESLLQAIPDRRFFHDLKHRDAVRDDGTSTRQRMYLYPELLRRLPAELRGPWLPIARALCSPSLQDAFKRKFRGSIEERFGQPAETLRFHPVPVLLRDQPGYRIGIHSDVPMKAITVQFYLPSDDRQQHVGTIFHESGEGPGANNTTQMPFLPASGYAFPVSLTKSWHSAAATSEADGERLSMMLTYYVTNDLYNRINNWVRRAGLWLGIRPAR